MPLVFVPHRSVRMTLNLIFVRTPVFTQTITICTIHKFFGSNQKDETTEMTVTTKILGRL
jgi:hypothetical protein